MWAIRGEHNTVYLAGSVHLLKAADAALPGAFDRAYRSSHQLVMELAMDKLDIRGWFAALVTAEETPRHKPEPDVFLEAARRLGVSAAACVVFEDTDIGLEAAHLGHPEGQGRQILCPYQRHRIREEPHLYRSDR